MPYDKTLCVADQMAVTILVIIKQLSGCFFTSAFQKTESLGQNPVWVHTQSDHILLILAKEKMSRTSLFFSISHQRRLRFHTARSGTLGQRTANTQGWGSKRAANCSPSGSASCQGSGCSSCNGRLFWAKPRKYLAACTVASDPPNSRSKILANSIHPSATICGTGLRAITPDWRGTDTSLLTLPENQRVLQNLVWKANEWTNIETKSSFEILFVVSGKESLSSARRTNNGGCRSCSLDMYSFTKTNVSLSFFARRREVPSSWSKWEGKSVRVELTQAMFVGAIA